MPAMVEVVARTLRQEGVRFAFGLPGGEVIDLVDALGRAGIQFILTGHETSAAMMAAVTAQLSGAPGVCVATLGPGAVNLLPGIAHCHLDRAPVLALTGDLPAAAAAVYTHQALDQNGLYRPVTRWSADLNCAAAQETVRKAIRLALEGRPGPVHLDLPVDQARQEAPFADHPAAAAAAARAAASAAAGAPAVAAALDRLGRARRPAVVAGLGCLCDGVTSEVQELAARLGAPVLVTPRAKGVVPESDARFLGVAGLGMNCDAALQEVLARADLVLAVGFDPAEVVRTWLPPWPADTPTVHLDRVPNTDGYYRAGAELVGHVGATLAALLAGLPAAPRAPWDDWPAARARLLAGLGAPGAAAAGGPSPGGLLPGGLLPGGLSPAAVISAVRAALPETAICAVDVGAHKILAAQLWRTEFPGGFLVSNGLSIMGFGVPAAIAARLNRPDQPVVAILGDGGFAMAMQEVETAVRLGLNIILVVFADQALSLIKLKQEARGLATAGVDFAAVDHAALARAMGARGVRITGLEDVPAAVAGALAHPGPVVMAVPVDPAEYRAQM